MQKLAPLSALILVSACGGGNNEGAVQFQRSVAASESVVLDCFFGVDPQVAAQVPPQLLGQLLPYQSSDLAKDVASGKTVFDSGKAATCLASLQLPAGGCWGPSVDLLQLAQPFVDLQTRHGACAGVFNGTLPPGGACVLDVECKDGWCDANTNTCPGLCHALGKAGDACERRLDANSKAPDAGLCASPLLCVQGKCAAPGASGASCDQNSDCQSGLACLQQQCAQPIAQGLPCTADELCAPGLFCDRPLNKCAPQGAPGASCDRSGSIGFTLHSAACKGNQLCAGGNVTNDQGDMNPTGTCQTPATAGATCKTSTGTDARFVDGCYLGLACDATNHCVSLAPVGGSCSHDDCTLGAFCDNTQTCAALKADLAACLGNRECASGSCISGHCDLSAPAACHGA